MNVIFMIEYGWLILKKDYIETILRCLLQKIYKKQRNE